MQKFLTKFQKIKLLIVAIISFLWFLYRTGTKPSRIHYPCQQASLAHSIFSLQFLLAYPLFNQFYRFFSIEFFIKRFNKLMLAIILVLLFWFSAVTSWDLWNNYQSRQVYEAHKLHATIVPNKSTEEERVSYYEDSFAQSFEHRVVSVHDSDATYWDHSCTQENCCGGPCYWEYIDQATVTHMVDRGVMQLTDTATRQDAWYALIPYQAGDDIAIKLNLNNSYDCDEVDNNFDALPETVNAVIAGLKSIGVPEESIWIFDASDSKVIPNRFINRIDFPGVRYFSLSPWHSCNEHTTYVDPTSPYVSGFTCPEGNLPDDVILPPQVLVDAEHLINIPLLKSHGSYVTLALKNHYGTVFYDLNDRGSMHFYFNEGGNTWGCPLETQNVLADINNNPQIRDKTRLIIGDGLFSNQFQAWGGDGGTPRRWPNMFNNDDPNILFFSIDPVAVSSVMTDYLIGERGWQAHEQLHAAADTHNLGVHEHWNNSIDKQYTNIEYIQLDLDLEDCPGTCMPLECGNYLDCTSSAGTCVSGYCCTGTCEGMSCVDNDGDFYYGYDASYCPDGDDCDDNDGNVYPGAPQICDGKNNDCDHPAWPSLPENEVDNDGDNYSECEGDCNDADPEINPGAEEICDGTDNDCDGSVDENFPMPEIIPPLDPHSAIQGSFLEVTINGNGFREGLTCDFQDGIHVHQCNFQNEHLIIASIDLDDDAMLGARDVIIANPDCGSDVCSECFEVTFDCTRTDLHIDDRVDGFDLAFLARAFGLSSDPGNPNYDPDSWWWPADLDGSSQVDGDDLALLASYFGEYLSSCE